jgi:hypothetical protein
VKFAHHLPGYYEIDFPLYSSDLFVPAIVFLQHRGVGKGVSGEV